MQPLASRRKVSAVQARTYDYDNELPPVNFGTPSNGATITIVPREPTTVQPHSVDTDDEMPPVLFSSSKGKSVPDLPISAASYTDDSTLSQPGHSADLKDTANCVYGATRGGSKKPVPFVNPVEVASWSPLKHFRPINELLCCGGDISRRVHFIVHEFGKSGGAQTTSREHQHASRDPDDGLVVDYDPDSRFQNPRGRGRGRGRGSAWAAKRRGGKQ